MKAMTSKEASNSPFQVGTEVALISHRSFGDTGIRKRIVGQVRRDGKFRLRSVVEGSTNDGLDQQVWTPEAERRHDDRWIANMAGSSSYRCWIEVWSTTHDETLAERSANLARQRRISKAKAALDQIHKMPDDDIDDLLSAIEAHPVFSKLKDIVG